MIKAIPSKSFAHRAYICSFLSEERPAVLISEDSEDMAATRRCLEQLDRGESEIDAGESGSTLRFLIPVIGTLGRDITIRTSGRLYERPLEPLTDELAKHGVTVEKKEAGIIRVSGKLLPGSFSLPGNISSQFVTGLLLALPVLDGNSEIVLTSPLESSDYVRMTLRVLMEFGAEAEVDGKRYLVPGPQKYHRDSDYTVEGDWSGSAFFLAAGVIGEKEVSVSGLDPFSIQGDRKIVDIINAFGGKIEKTGPDVFTAYPSDLKGIKIDVSEVPDLAPVIAVLGAAAEGTTEIVNAGRLRLKESDRIKTIVKTLADTGTGAFEKEDGILITGSGGSGGILPVGGETSSEGDHRIAMMAAVLSLITAGKVTIEGGGAVRKSYPGFFKALDEEGLGMNVIAK